MTKTFAVMKRSVFNSFHCFSDKEKAVQKCIDKAESIPGVQVVVVEIADAYTARKEEK